MRWGRGWQSLQGEAGAVTTDTARVPRMFRNNTYQLSREGRREHPVPGGTQVQIKSELTTSTPFPAVEGSPRRPCTVERPLPTVSQLSASHSRPHPHQSGGDPAWEGGSEELAIRSWIIYEAR